MVADDLKTECVNNLSQFIRECRVSLRSEEHEPGGNVDASDDKVKTLKDKIAKAESLRIELEKLFYST